MPTYTIPAGGTTIGLPPYKLSVLTNIGTGSVRVDGAIVAPGATVSFPANDPSTDIVDIQGPGTATVRIDSVINREENTTTNGAWKKLFASTSNPSRKGIIVTNPSLNGAVSLFVRSVPKGAPAPSSVAAGSETFQIFPGSGFPLGDYGDASKDVYVLGDGLSISYMAEEV